MPRAKAFNGTISFPAGVVKTVTVPGNISISKVFDPTKPVAKSYEVARPIYTLDMETDPFEHGKTPEPFAVGLYNGVEYRDCVNDDPQVIREWVRNQLRHLPPKSIVYVHNGGKFDFMLIQDFLNESKDQPLAMVGSRLARIDVGEGRSVELRDSFCAVPVPLRQWKKDDIDYAKMRRDQRHHHMTEIKSYLCSDCVYLHELVCGFIDRFGFKLTIGSAALSEMLATAPTVQGREWNGDLQTLGRKLDKLFREFYFGGRVEVFERGEVKGAFKVYDANSAYPNALARYQHPCTEKYKATRRLEHIADCSFAVVTGTARGCFPLRSDDGGIHFPHTRATFRITGHELRKALELGLFDLDVVERLYVFEHRRNYADFVWQHYGEKRRAKEAAREATAAGNEAEASRQRIAELFHKLALNSCIGKLGQNPDEHREHILTSELRGRPWRIEETYNMPQDRHIMSRKLRYTPEERERLMGLGWTADEVKDVKGIGQRYNVATAASVVGAARAEIMGVIALSKRVLLCDTDSVVCEGFAGATMDPFELGAWDLEQEGDTAFIAGRKMYALVDTSDPSEMRLIKKATKGVRLDLDEIVQVIREGQAVYKSLVPSWSFTSATAPQFVTRTVRPT